MEHDKPLTIIIVDDDEDDRELLRFLFNQNENFELIGCFDSGMDVIEEILNKKNIPDVLVIDMYMPFLTGIEVVSKLEESGVAPNMNKFIISTTINNSEQSKHQNNPSIKFIKKPASLVEINDLPGFILESLNHSNNMRV
ncbi:MAG TPA: response regulator [Flavobacterium sp.]|uniref:response regulator n=1 Tax=Flavobacterium sp. TaxID=239 RepID=UPI002CA3AF7A|nr:response regulator [Flavobacterium sp.]HNP33815.1 response regulator [Flavobacterium sp.]